MSVYDTERERVCVCLRGGASMRERNGVSVCLCVGRGGECIRG